MKQKWKAEKNLPDEALMDQFTESLDVYKNVSQLLSKGIQ